MLLSGLGLIVCAAGVIIAIAADFETAIVPTSVALLAVEALTFVYMKVRFGGRHVRR